MPYLIASDLPEAPAGARFRAALARPGILQLPGAHSGMAALQARAAGFQALYLSGAAMTAIARATSSTVRASGPMARPRYGGSTGTSP